MKPVDILIQQAEILRKLQEAGRIQAIHDDRMMKIHNVISVVLHVALIFSIGMAVIPQFFR